jgi:alpha-D-xyloside xylohydrolase
MQLHGRANLTPWTVPEDPDRTVEIYRYWAKLHAELVPFFYSLAEEAYAGGENIVRPIGDAGDYRYQLGDAFFVAPILDHTGIRDVILPPGNWYDWWDPDGAELSGTLIDHDATDELRIPLFVAEGAIVPREIDGKLIIFAWPSDEETRFVLHEDAPIELTLTRNTFRIARTQRPAELRVRTAAGTIAIDLPESDDPAEFTF